MEQKQKTATKSVSDCNMYEVIRNLAPSNLDKAGLTVAGEHIYVNRKCLHKFPNVSFIRFLIRRDIHRIIIEPCDGQYRDTFRWCSSNEKRSPRHIKCVPFTYMIYEMMSWNFGLKYVINGKIETSDGGRQVIAFNLDRAVAAGMLSKDDSEADEWAKRYRQTVTVDMEAGITVSYENVEAERAAFSEDNGQRDIDIFSENSIVKIPMNVREEVTGTLSGTDEEIDNI